MAHIYIGAASTMGLVMLPGATGGAESQFARLLLGMDSLRGGVMHG